MKANALRTILLVAADACSRPSPSPPPAKPAPQALLVHDYAREARDAAAPLPPGITLEQVVSAWRNAPACPVLLASRASHVTGRSDTTVIVGTGGCVRRAEERSWVAVIADGQVAASLETPATTIDAIVPAMGMDLVLASGGMFWNGISSRHATILGLADGKLTVLRDLGQVVDDTCALSEMNVPLSKEPHRTFVAVFRRASVTSPSELSLVRNESRCAEAQVTDAAGQHP
jgi:hypothetical protein